MNQPKQKTAGLTSREAEIRRRRGQGNARVDSSAKTVKDIVRENTLTYFNLIFLAMALLLVIVGAFNSLTFLPVIVANTLIGIFQEVHAKKILDNLSIMNAPTATALRDGCPVTLLTDDLVLGDVVVLSAGDQIPADARVLTGEVAVNEALLTGESDEITKTAGDALMSGAFVVNGTCRAVLTAVGADAYIAKLTLQAKSLGTGEESEMVRAINGFVKVAGVLIIPIGIILLVQSIGIQGTGFAPAVKSAVAALIGMIPEGLYLLVSVTLAVSAVRLARRQVMLHDMKSIEALARVDVLCVDKTGTITDNDMLVAEAVAARPMTARAIEDYGAVAGRYLGALPDDNATNRALCDYFGKTVARAISTLPFSSRYKYSAVQFEDATYVLGAPEIVLAGAYACYRKSVDAYARRGLRVVVFGQYASGSVPVPEDGLAAPVTPIFFIMLQNPVRETAPATFAYFADQGVAVKVISGDNPVTVSEVARQAGIAGAEHYVNAQTLTDADQIADAVKKTTVFGRVTPEQKRQIVGALKAQGHTVAMTGDGVNDILAMKDADCSIAMAAGSEAAVQAAQVALLDSDFSHMTQIVAEGRRVINNIERSATLFLVKNIFSLLLSIFTIVSVVTYPLTPSQISLISGFNIGIPAFFLAMEANSRRIRGDFAKTVLLRAMPAALTDFLAIAALVVFGQTFGVAAKDISVAATLLLAIVGFMILHNISMPMNKFRIGVIAGCAVGLVTAIVALRGLFDIHAVSPQCFMLFVVFAIAVIPCMRLLTRFFAFIGSKINP